MGGEGIGTIFWGETFVTGWGQYPITCHVRVALNLISVEVLMLKAFCLIVGSNAWGNSLDWKFSFVIFNAAPGWYFAANFSLFSWIFVSLTFLCNVTFFIKPLHFLVRISVLFLWVFQGLSRQIFSDYHWHLIRYHFLFAPKKFICAIAFGSASSCFSLLKSITISLCWLLVQS